MTKWTSTTKTMKTNLDLILKKALSKSLHALLSRSNQTFPVSLPNWRHFVHDCLTRCFLDCRTVKCHLQIPKRSSESREDCFSRAPELVYHFDRLRQPRKTCIYLLYRQWIKAVSYILCKPGRRTKQALTSCLSKHRREDNLFACYEQRRKCWPKRVWACLRNSYWIHFPWSILLSPLRSFTTHSSCIWNVGLLVWRLDLWY